MFRVSLTIRISELAQRVGPAMPVRLFDWGILQEWNALIGTMHDHPHMEQMDEAPKLNGTAPRAKFADVVLPTFPQRRNHTA